MIDLAPPPIIQPAKPSLAKPGIVLRPTTEDYLRYAGVPGTVAGVGLIASDDAIGAPTLDDEHNDGSALNDTISKSVVSAGPHTFVAFAANKLFSGASTITSATFDSVPMTKIFGYETQGSEVAGVWLYYIAGAQSGVCEFVNSADWSSGRFAVFSIDGNLRNPTSPVDDLGSTGIAGTAATGLGSAGYGGIRLIITNDNLDNRVTPTNCTELSDGGLSANTDVSLYVGYSLGAGTDTMSWSGGDRTLAGAFR